MRSSLPREASFQSSHSRAELIVRKSSTVIAVLRGSGFWIRRARSGNSANLCINSAQLSFSDGDSHKNVGNSLGCGTRIAQSICITLDIVLVGEFAVARD